MYCSECADQQNRIKCPKGIWKSEKICKLYQDGWGECETLETCLYAKKDYIRKMAKAYFFLKTTKKEINRSA